MGPQRQIYACKVIIFLWRTGTRLNSRGLLDVWNCVLESYVQTGLIMLAESTLVRGRCRIYLVSELNFTIALHKHELKCNAVMFCYTTLQGGDLNWRLWPTQSPGRTHTHTHTHTLTHTVTWLLCSSRPETRLHVSTIPRYLRASFSTQPSP